MRKRISTLINMNPTFVKHEIVCDFEHPNFYVFLFEEVGQPIKENQNCLLDHTQRHISMAALSHSTNLSTSAFLRPQIKYATFHSGTQSLDLSSHVSCTYLRLVRLWWRSAVVKTFRKTKEHYDWLWNGFFTSWCLHYGKDFSSGEFQTWMKIWQHGNNFFKGVLSRGQVSWATSSP